MLQLVAAEVPGTRQEIEFELLRVRGEIELRELWFSRLAAALAALDDTDEEEREQTTIDWLRHNCRLTHNVAADRVRIGEKLPQMPRSEDALYNGELGIQHLAVMARTAVAVGEGFDESKLLAWPRSCRRAGSTMSPSTTGTRCGRKRWLRSRPTSSRTVASP